MKRKYPKVYQIIIACLTFIIFNACNTNIKSDESMNYSEFYVGTYTDKESKGIYKYRLQDNGKIKLIGLATETENPSFLCKSTDGKFVIAVNEISNSEGVGTVESYKVEKDSLIFINRSSSGGAHPCYVSTNNEGYILTANYSGGNIGLLQIDKNGRLSELLHLHQHIGNGTTDRQKRPHAHSAMFYLHGDLVISADLGTNELWLYNLDKVNKKLEPYSQPKLGMAHGAGPRHLSVHPNNKWLYVINELNSTISQVSINANNLFELVNSVPTLPNEFESENYCADIHITSDGKFLYASNRGDNSIAIFSIDPDNGSLKLLGYESTRGEWPRNFSLSPDDNFLMVANQHSNNIVSFKRDKISGLLKYIDQIKSPSPVNILF